MGQLSASTRGAGGGMAFAPTWSSVTTEPASSSLDAVAGAGAVMTLCDVTRSHVMGRPKQRVSARACGARGSGGTGVAQRTVGPWTGASR